MVFIHWQCWPSAGCKVVLIGKVALIKILMILVALEHRQSLCGPADACGAHSLWMELAHMDEAGLSDSAEHRMTYLLHFSHAFHEDFLKAPLGMAAALPER